MERPSRSLHQDSDTSKTQRSTPSPAQQPHNKNHLMRTKKTYSSTESLPTLQHSVDLDTLSDGIHNQIRSGSSLKSNTRSNVDNQDEKKATHSANTDISRITNADKPLSRQSTIHLKRCNIPGIANSAKSKKNGRRLKERVGGESRRRE